MTMKTYEFWTLNGRHLGNIVTDDPAREASELAHFNSVEADEIECVMVKG